MAADRHSENRQIDPDAQTARHPGATGQALLRQDYRVPLHRLRAIPSFPRKRESRRCPQALVRLVTQAIPPSGQGDCFATPRAGRLAMTQRALFRIDRL